MLKSKQKFKLRKIKINIEVCTMYMDKPVHCIKNGAAITAVHGLQDVD